MASGGDHQKHGMHVQDIAAGDGTTSVVVLCGALLRKCLTLLEQGVHPTLISDGFNRAVGQAVKVQLCFTVHVYA